MNFWIWFSLIASGLAAVVSMVPRLFWTEVIEGQVEKQNFLAQMTESYLRGDRVQGFPIRFFAEPWHPGPVPWAEEVPLFHGLAALISKVFNCNTVTSGRMLSFGFGLLLLFSVYEIGKVLFYEARPEKPWVPFLAPVVLLLTPGFETYATDPIPDIAMVAMIAFGYSRALKEKTTQAFLALGVACLFKYYAVFSVLGLFLYEASRRRGIKPKLWNFLLAGIAVLPTLCYLGYFLAHKIPNPITEYRLINGYGHLAGPFVFKSGFYLRVFTWVFIKSPNLIFSALASFGAGVILKHRSKENPKWNLIGFHLLTQFLFALVFASSFYVHNYYALGFLISTSLLAAFGLQRIKKTLLVPPLLIAGLILSFTLVKDATFRYTNYLSAAKQVRLDLGCIPDRDQNHLVVFVTDYPVTPLQVLSQKAGWVFNAKALEEQGVYLKERLRDSRTEAVVFYLRDPGSEATFSRWMASAPEFGRLTLIKKESYPKEGDRGAATTLWEYLPVGKLCRFP